MRGLFVASALLAGCSLLVGDDDASDSGTDITPIEACPDDATLAACYLFEGDGVDGSANANDATTIAGVAYVPGRAGMAASFSNNDRMTVTEDGTTLDMVDVTMEVWVRPDAFAAPGDRAGIFDVDREYSLFIDDVGRIKCNGAGGLPDSGALVRGEWTHVACTIMAGVEIKLYIDGVVVNQDTATTLDLGDGNIEIGGDAPYATDDSHFIGELDNLLIWRVPRSRAELCATSGLDC